MPKHWFQEAYQKQSPLASLSRCRWIAVRSFDRHRTAVFVGGRFGVPLLQVCVVSRGSKACLVRSCKGEHFTSSPPEVGVVDTVGAGDCFAAGFLHAYLRGSNLQVKAAMIPALCASLFIVVCFFKILHITPLLCLLIVCLLLSERLHSSPLQSWLAYLEVLLPYHLRTVPSMHICRHAHR